MKIRFSLVLLFVTLISGCDSNEDDLVGRWINKDSDCDVLCGFTVIERENAYSDKIVEFDQGPFYKGANGPLIRVEYNKYLVKGNLGDFLIVKKGKNIYSADGGIYEKEGNLFGKWINIDKKCVSLCSFTVLKDKDTKNIRVTFLDNTYYNGYDGLLFKTDENKYVIKGTLGDFLLTKTDSEFHSLDGAIYKKDN
ncbi:MAG: hypothetical protein RSE33_08675 [Hafnia sp.]